MNPFRFLEAFETWGPHIDGELIKEQAVTAFQKGHWQKEKAVLLGKRHREGKKTYTMSYICQVLYFSTILRYILCQVPKKEKRGLLYWLGALGPG